MRAPVWCTQTVPWLAFHENMLASCAQLDRHFRSAPALVRDTLCTPKASCACMKTRWGQVQMPLCVAARTSLLWKLAIEIKKKRRKWRVCPRPAYLSLTVAAQCQQIRACTTPHETTVTHTRTQATGACNDICVGQLTRYSEAPISVACGTPRLRYNPFFLARTSQFACIYMSTTLQNKSIWERHYFFFFWP